MFCIIKNTVLSNFIITTGLIRNNIFIITYFILRLIIQKEYLF